MNLINTDNAVNALYTLTSLLFRQTCSHKTNKRDEYEIHLAHIFRK